MTQDKIYNYPEVMTESGYDAKNMYCTMLNMKADYNTKGLSTPFPEEYLYYSESKPWVNGLVLESEPHISLHCGTISDQSKSLIKLFKDWEPGRIEIAEISHFDSSNEEEYKIIIGKIKLTPELVAANDRVSFLPHVDAFAGYVPHITLAYVKNTEEALAAYKEAFENTDIILLPESVVFDNNSGEPKLIKQL